MSTSTAAIFAGRAGEIELRQIAIPQPRGEELLVRVLGCTLCGSDLHTFEGRRTVATPTVLGHEIVGQIVTVGETARLEDVGGTPLRIGDRVSWAIVASCGQCFACRRGLPQKCLQGVKYGHEAMRAGRELLGGLAGHCLLVSGTAVVRVPDSLDLATACPASCATATVVAVIEAAGTLADRCVVVLGAGMLGLTAAAMASAAGARDIVCVDPRAERRDRAAGFGAKATAPPSELGRLVAERTGGHGADAVLELSGASSAIETAWPCLRTGGTLVLAGTVFPGPPVSWLPEQIVRRQLSIRGVHNYAPKHLVEAMRFLEAEQGRFPFRELVTPWFPLADVRSAFRAAGEPDRVRVGVRP